MPETTFHTKFSISLFSLSRAKNGSESGLRSGVSYRFGFNHAMAWQVPKENDNEVKGTGNSVDFGARMYDSRLGRWLSLDPLQTKYPSLSPYQFCANSPVLLIEIGGKWFVKFDNAEDPKQLVFVAEEGDDLSTLEIQLGLKAGALSNNENLNGLSIQVNTELSNELNIVSAVANINNYLSSRGTDEETNCAMSVLASQNIEIPKGKFNEAMDILENYLNDPLKVTNIRAEDTKIGDFVNIGYDLTGLFDLYKQHPDWFMVNGTDEEVKGYLKETYNKSSLHFQVVLLKDKTGQKPAQVLDKSGTTPIKIVEYLEVQPSWEGVKSEDRGALIKWIARPYDDTKDTTPFYEFKN